MANVRVIVRATAARGGSEQVLQEVPAALRNGLNAAVLSYIRDMSAHDEVGVALMNAVKPLGDVQIFCPDGTQYRYLVTSTAAVIFGIAFGMHSVAFRLDARMRPRALATGGEPLPDCGEAWVCFTLFRDDWPQVDLPFWALKAYVYARETAEANNAGSRA